MKGRRWLTWAGRALMALSLALVAYRLTQYDLDLALFARPAFVAGFAGLSLLFCLVILYGGALYGAILATVSGRAVDMPYVVQVYSTSNLMKYIPGNVFQYVGRNRMAAEREDIRHGDVIAATLAETALLLLCACGLAAACVWQPFWAYLRQAGLLPLLPIGALALLGLGAAVWLLAKKRPAFAARWRQLRQSLTAGKVLLCVGGTVLRLLLIAGSYVPVLFLLGQRPGVGTLVTVVGLFIMAWAIGFLTPGAPGGLGVREAILLMFLQGSLLQDVILTSVIVHRVVCIAGDVLAWLAVLAAARWRRGRQAADTQK